jgi:hypothetical protein
MMKHYVVEQTKTFRFEAKNFKEAKRYFFELGAQSDVEYQSETTIVEEESGRDERL